MWGQVIGAGIGLASSLLGDRANRRRAAEERAQLERLHGLGKQYYEPFINRGATAQDQASAAYQQMLQNPTTFVEQIMNSYRPSEGYNFRRKNILDAARNSAAAGGFSGTGYDQMQQAELANGLLGQDMQQYLQNILGVHGAGLAGQQHVGDTGFQAAGGLADYLGNATLAQTQLRQAQNQQAGSNRAGISGMLSNFLGQGMNVLGSGQLSDTAGSFGGPGGFLSKVFGGFK